MILFVDTCVKYHDNHESMPRKWNLDSKGYIVYDFVFFPHRLKCRADQYLFPFTSPFIFVQLWQVHATWMTMFYCYCTKTKIQSFCRSTRLKGSSTHQLYYSSTSTHSQIWFGGFQVCLAINFALISSFPTLNFD